jgi:predicted nuclease with TOPRIM domain
MQNLISIADNQVALDQQKLADAQAAEIEKQAEVKRNQAEENRLRREKLASELPKVEAETQQNQTKLEQLRAEMARIEAVVQKNLEEKQKLADEMARLGQEAEDQLQAQREKLKDLTSQETRSSADGMFDDSPSMLPPLFDTFHISCHVAACPKV